MYMYLSSSEKIDAYNATAVCTAKGYIEINRV